MKKERKQKIKDKLSMLKKPLMILSIVFNILFALALVIGLSSKPKAQSVSAEDNVSYNVRGVTFHCKSLNLWTCEGLAEVYQSSQLNLKFYPTMVIGNNTYSYDYFDIVRVNTIYTQTGRQYGIYWRLDDTTSSYPTSSVNFLFDINHTYEDFYYVYNTDQISNLDKQTTFTISFPNDDDYISEDLYKMLSLNSITIDNDPNAPIEPQPVPTQNHIDVINLGNNFNPITYVTLNGDFILNGFAGLHTGVTTGYLDFTGLTFESNGQEFNRIRFLIMPLNAYAPIVTLDGTTYIDTSTDYSNYICCAGVFYQYVENQNVTLSIQVTSYRKTIINDNGTNINAYDVRQPYIIWINNNYRTLNIIDDTGEVISSNYLTISGLSTKELLQVTSSVNDSVMGLTDVFGVLKGAFSGITGILAISILPGITLGLLLFIPLIVTIIVAVVRLIKK